MINPKHIIYVSEKIENRRVELQVFGLMFRSPCSTCSCVSCESGNGQTSKLSRERSGWINALGKWLSMIHITGCRSHLQLEELRLVCNKRFSYIAAFVNYLLGDWDANGAKVGDECSLTAITSVVQIIIILQALRKYNCEIFIGYGKYLICYRLSIKLHLKVLLL